ncbi:hypothetical protein M0655_05405 [Gordonia amicalis]|uniref:ImmA/IrrE family metallo-endopeptidase n=1 Tax=Gordonia amicalis TaxID=89053 RepID=UPI00200A8E67|nr:hypothetical protein [Gordonia amicalis]UPW15025.1 hypothetical protein M0655_05405 [Gordonia amicalis]
MASKLIEECTEFDLDALRDDPVGALTDCEPVKLVFEEDLPSGGCGGGGYYRPDPPTIHLHPAIGRRDNFTVLHELGHHLQQGHPEWAFVLLELPVERRRPIEESVSNHFAAQVLMPITDRDREDASVHPADFMAGFYSRVNASRSATLIRAREILPAGSRWILVVAELDGTVIASSSTYADLPPAKGFRQEGFARVALEALDRPVRQFFSEGLEYRTGSVLDDLYIEAALDVSGQYVFIALRPTSMNGQGTITYPSHECADEGCGEVFVSRQSTGKCDECGSFRCPECHKCACMTTSRPTTVCGQCRTMYSRAEMQTGNHECF